jgi:hypothetical protein
MGQGRVDVGVKKQGLGVRDQFSRPRNRDSGPGFSNWVNKLVDEEDWAAWVVIAL